MTATARIPAVFAGDQVSVGAAITGRVNLHAAVHGVVVLDGPRIDAFNHLARRMLFVK